MSHINNILKIQAFAWISCTVLMTSCAGSSGDKESNKGTKTTAGGSNTSNSNLPQTVSTTGSVDGTTAGALSQPSEACWNKIFKSPEALACGNNVFSYSSKTCVSTLVKAATCNRDVINAAYGSSTLNGQPLMAQVDAWLADGYVAEQCATGSDSKLYVYLVKKVFTPREQSTNNVDHYAVADKKLGPSGAIFDSIKLTPASAASEMTCN